MEAPSKTCSLDPLPTIVLNDILQEIMPFVAGICNASHQDGRLPVGQRHAVVTPRLKGLMLTPQMIRTTDRSPTSLSNQRVVDRLVCHQLVPFLDANDLLPKLQSAYRKHHYTEAAVLKVISDALLATDRGEVTLLCLLDLSAAFDTVDHYILNCRQRSAFMAQYCHGFHLFLKDRTQTVTLAGSRSNTSDVKCGVPQGSTLGPVLFLLYTAEVTAIAHRHSVDVHSYADNTQLHIQRKADDLESSIPH